MLVGSAECSFSQIQLSEAVAQFRLVVQELPPYIICVKGSHLVVRFICVVYKPYCQLVCKKTKNITVHMIL